MMFQVDQDLCTGCGACIETCKYGAIRMDNQWASIDSQLCTQCGACVEACPSEAIIAVSEPARISSDMVQKIIVSQPMAETQLAPYKSKTELPKKTSFAHAITQIAGAALTLLGREAAPRLVDLVIEGLERRFIQSGMASETNLPVYPDESRKQNRGKGRQTRYRGKSKGKQSSQPRRGNYLSKRPD
jgi:Fe-S-cluster-containing hydrogenase component 2